MNAKFDFYEIVTIVSKDPKHKDIDGKLGVIRGIAQNEETHEWIYGISVYDTDGSIRRVYEHNLQSTGKKADAKEFMAGENIKVKVDPSTGEGRIT